MRNRITSIIWVWNLRKWLKLSRTFQYSDLSVRKSEIMFSFFSSKSIKGISKYIPLGTPLISSISFLRDKLSSNTIKSTPYPILSLRLKAAAKAVSICNLPSRPKPSAREVTLDKRKWFFKNHRGYCQQNVKARNALYLKSINKNSKRCLNIVIFFNA